MGCLEVAGESEKFGLNCDCIQQLVYSNYFRLLTLSYLYVEIEQGPFPCLN